MSAGKRALLRFVLGEVLRRIRLEQGRTLAEVALSARISLPYLSEVERGRKEVSSEVLAALCAALGIDLADLLGGVVFHLTSDSAVVAVPPVTVARPAPSTLRPSATFRQPTALRPSSVRRQPSALPQPSALRPGEAYTLAA